jgi:hypothetical protein
MSPSFFNAMAEEPDAVAILEREVETLKFNQNLILADRPGTLILATRSLPGSLYEAVSRQPAGPISSDGGLLRPTCWVWATLEIRNSSSNAKTRRRCSGSPKGDDSGGRGRGQERVGRIGLTSRVRSPPVHSLD